MRGGGVRAVSRVEASWMAAEEEEGAKAVPGPSLTPPHAPNSGQEGRKASSTPACQLSVNPREVELQRSLANQDTHRPRVLR